MISKHTEKPEAWQSGKKEVWTARAAGKTLMERHGTSWCPGPGEVSVGSACTSVSDSFCSNVTAWRELVLTAVCAWAGEGSAVKVHS